LKFKGITIKAKSSLIVNPLSSWENLDLSIKRKMPNMTFTCFFNIPLEKLGKGLHTFWDSENFMLKIPFGTKLEIFD